MSRPSASGVWNITGGDHPETLPGFYVTSNLFSFLGVQPMFGRTFLPEEDQPDARGTVIITDEFWRRRFGGDSNILSDRASPFALRKMNWMQFPTASRSNTRRQTRACARY